MLHALKTIQPYFDEVVKGNKNFEIRKDDRPFESGDKIVLQEFVDGKYTGKEAEFEIGYILRDAKQFGLKDGYVVLSLLTEKES